MISPEKVAQVKELLARGDLSHRKIATITSISRATIGAIASGKRPDYENRPHPESDAYLPIGPVARCPRCGGNVHLPCLLCHVRQIKAAERALARAYRKRYRELMLRRFIARLRREHATSSEQAPTARAG